MRIIQSCFIMAICGVLSGCLWNNVDSINISDTHKPVFGSTHFGRATLVYGVANARVILDEYSLEGHDKKGDCAIYNRADANNNSQALRYFAFNVPPGYYTPSPDVVLPFGVPHTSVPFAASYQNMAFFVPEGSVVYIGDFVATEKGLEFKRDLAAAKAALFEPNLSLAESVPASRESQFIVCF